MDDGQNSLLVTIRHGALCKRASAPPRRIGTQEKHGLDNIPIVYQKQLLVYFTKFRKVV